MMNYLILKKEKNINQDKNHKLTYNGVTKSITEWVKEIIQQTYYIYPL